MARRTSTVTIDAEGRDIGKVFVLREMSATQAEAWASQALLALARGGVDVPPDLAASGLAGVAKMGLKAFSGLSYAEARPLLAEMFTCIQIQPNPSNPAVVRALIEDDIEEVATRLKLRLEVFQLHLGFSLPVARSISTATEAETTKTVS